ncbi:hypothetical protein G3T14_22620 [Methylobacterium sp. BTF04]|nr:hypothetical protein [Methylobacterium sp. BTF04]
MIPDRLLDIIIKGVIQNSKSRIASERHSENALLARLRRKFNKNKDILLRAVGAENLPERGPGLARARRDLDKLEDAGILIDRSGLDPALARQPIRSRNM